MKYSNIKGKLSLKIMLSVICFLSLSTNSCAQKLIHSDIVVGGLTGNGISTTLGSGNVTFNLNIPANSRIKKSFLLATRDSLADDITINMNGLNYSFSDNTIITKGFNPLVDGNLTRHSSSIHMIDVTNDIDSSVSTYNINVPPQQNFQKGAYMQFYLVVIFEKNGMPAASIQVMLNEKNTAIISSYNLLYYNKVDYSKSMCLSVVNSYACDTLTDGSFVDINSINIGLIGGADSNSKQFICPGVWGNFSFFNDTIFGLDDDTADSLMLGTDALADIRPYVNNGDTSVKVQFRYQTPSLGIRNGPLTNPIRALMLSYSTPCDTFTTSITANDTICYGDSAQLVATGGKKYHWWGAFGGLSDTAIADPKASPKQTTTYICTITNDSGCVKTEQVKVFVNLPVTPTNVIVTPNTCGDTSGVIAVDSMASGKPPFSYALFDIQTSATTNQSTGSFTGLLPGDYLLTITDSNGCFWKSDTLTVGEQLGVQALFDANPQTGVVPLTVDMVNNATGGNYFNWWITDNNTDTLYQRGFQNTTAANAGINYLFDKSGTYKVCLAAYNNLPACADTLCKTIQAQDELVITLPNVFSPNGDEINDVFLAEVVGMNQLQTLTIEVFNRWGAVVRKRTFDHFDDPGFDTGAPSLTLWDGYTPAGKPVPASTYFYVLSYTTTSGENGSLEGTVTVLR